MKPARRAGFSLLEVLLATGILLGSLIVLGQLAVIGRKHADDAENLTTAQLICQTKLNEILGGASPVRSVEQQPVQGAPGWVYSVEVESLGRRGLASLRVTVAEDLPESPQAADGPRGKPFTLTRWIRDPRQQDLTSSRSDLPELSPFGQGFGGDEFP